MTRPVRIESHRLAAPNVTNNISEMPSTIKIETKTKSTLSSEKYEGRKANESNHESDSCIHSVFLSFCIFACLSGGSLSVVVDKDDYGTVIAPSAPHRSIAITEINVAIPRKVISNKDKRNEEFVFER